MVLNDTDTGKYCPKCTKEPNDNECFNANCPCHTVLQSSDETRRDTRGVAPTTTTGEVPKADMRPSTEEWYKTTLAIKEFCEEKEIHVGDTAYGWLSTFFHEMFSTLLAAEREKAAFEAIKQFREDAYGAGIEVGRTQTKEAILVLIEEAMFDVPEDSIKIEINKAFVVLANEIKKV